MACFGIQANSFCALFTFLFPAGSKSTVPLAAIVMCLFIRFTMSNTKLVPDM